MHATFPRFEYLVSLYTLQDFWCVALMNQSKRLDNSGYPKVGHGLQGLCHDTISTRAGQCLRILQGCNDELHNRGGCNLTLSTISVNENGSTSIPCDLIRFVCLGWVLVLVRISSVARGVQLQLLHGRAPHSKQDNQLKGKT